MGAVPLKRITVIAVASLVALVSSAPVCAQDGDRTVLSGKVELARLVDLSAARLALDLEYDPTTLRGNITMRSTTGLSDQELWSLTQRVLAANGFTTVIQPGQKTISIVKLAEAPALARLEFTGTPDLIAGYSQILVQLEYADPAEVVKTVKPLLSRPGGSIAPFGNKSMLLLSDLKPRIEQAMMIVEMLDVPAQVPPITRVEVKFLSPIQLSSAVLSASTVRDTIAGRTSKGKLLPALDGGAVLLIAPLDEQDQWLELIERFDQRQEVRTQSYTSSQFSIEEVAGLIEQAARETGPRGSGDQWKMILDDLTSTLVITATPSEHESIVSLLDRLDKVPASARRTVRSFKIRNRPVGEIMEVLSRLQEEGVIQSRGDTEPRAAEDRTIRQRTVRDDLPFDPRDLVRTDELGPVMAAGRDTPAAAANRVSRISDSELTLTSDEPTNTLIALGPSRILDQVESIILELDVRQPQVMLEVLMIALTESDMLDLGVEIKAITITGSTVLSLASLFGLSTVGPGTEPTTGDGEGLTGIVLSPGDFSVVIRALQAINDGRSLVIPRVLVNNNEQAVLDSVLQQPFQSTNASTTVATTSFGGTQDAGTTVTVRPSIAEGDYLILEYAVTRSAFVGDTTNPALPPPRQQNSFESIVTIPDNYTVVVGGIESHELSEAVQQIPLLGDIPLIGELFKSRSKTMTKTWFYVFIRPTIMRNRNFEDLKYMSDQYLAATEVDSGWPTLEPGIIR